jgi:cytochrome c556
MIKHVVIAAAAVALGVTGVVAQGDPIAARKDVMKGNGAQSRTLREMAEGKRPFDAAAAKKAFAAMAAGADKLGTLFPDNSKTGGDTKALPVIWEKKADFNAAIAKFAKDAKDAEAKVKDLDSLKAALGEVGKNCGGCHNAWRQKSS